MCENGTFPTTHPTQLCPKNMLYNTYFSKDKVGLTLKVFSRRMYSTVLFFVAVFPADIKKFKMEEKEQT